MRKWTLLDKIRNLVALYTSTTSSRKNLNLLAETEPLRFVCDSLFYLYAEKSAREMVLDEREIKIFQFPSSRLFPVYFVLLHHTTKEYKSTCTSRENMKCLVQEEEKTSQKKIPFPFFCQFFFFIFCFWDWDLRVTDDFQQMLKLYFFIKDYMYVNVCPYL